MKNDVLNPSTKNQGPAGLTSAQVAERVERGQVNRLPDAPRRTVGEIIKANVVTRFNLILGMLVVLILAIAPIQDALFGLVLIVNAAIGIVQELRAKKTLEQLQVINEPRVEVIRDAVAQAVPVERVVLGDLIAIRAGDQLVVDGAVASSTGLEVDESLLTGESDPVPKPAGSECRSGSFVVAGSGTMTATRVGADSYASRLALEARKFTLVNSELKRGIDVILAVIGWSLIPIGGLLVFTQRNLEGGLTAALSGAVAGMVAMIPQGLVLLTSIAFAVAVVRLGRRRVLVQELPAVEILARVDTICFDKTGTITEGPRRPTCCHHRPGMDGHPSGGLLIGTRVEWCGLRRAGHMVLGSAGDLGRGSSRVVAQGSTLRSTGVSGTGAFARTGRRHPSRCSHADGARRARRRPAP